MSGKDKAYMNVVNAILIFIGAVILGWYCRKMEFELVWTLTLSLLMTFLAIGMIEENRSTNCISKKEDFKNPESTQEGVNELALSEMFSDKSKVKEHSR